MSERRETERGPHSSDGNYGDGRRAEESAPQTDAPVQHEETTGGEVAREIRVGGVGGMMAGIAAGAAAGPVGEVFGAVLGGAIGAAAKHAAVEAARGREESRTPAVSDRAAGDAAGDDEERGGPEEPGERNETVSGQVLFPANYLSGAGVGPTASPTGGLMFAPRPDVLPEDRASDGLDEAEIERRGLHPDEDDRDT